MKVTLFTSNQIRHNYFINLLSINSSKLFVVQETNNKNSNTFTLDNSFLNLTYKDIEYFNTCVYCFYIQKNLPRFQFSSIEENIKFK